jgi:hypothetical protein
MRYTAIDAAAVAAAAPATNNTITTTSAAAAAHFECLSHTTKTNLRFKPMLRPALHYQPCAIRFLNAIPSQAVPKENYPLRKASATATTKWYSITKSPHPSGQNIGEHAEATPSITQNKYQI